jgi:hypothetical protein
MMEILVLLLFFLAFCVFGLYHGYQHYRDERVRKRAVARWSERLRVRSLLRLVKGGKHPDHDRDKDEPGPS